MSGSLAARRTDKESEKGRVDQTRVKRYWAGRAPDWVDSYEEEQGLKERVRTEIAAPVVVRKADDPRLRRLALTQEEREEAQRGRREIRAAEIVKRVEINREVSGDEAEGTSDEEESDDEGIEGDAPVKEAEEIDEEELARRRQAVRERLLKQRKEEELLAPVEEEVEESESTSYESDSEDDIVPGKRLLKPVFVPKTQRETIAERERLVQEEEELALKEKQRKEERKFETRQLVAEVVAAEEAATRARAVDTDAVNEEDVNTDDEVDEAAEYEAWKARELRRIRRAREEKETAAREAEERERLKNMTEEERREWDRLHPKVVAKAPKKKWKFLQKYWHRGAFFQEAPDDTRGTTGGDSIYSRDYSNPTGEDVFDKTILPKVMQVKNFGRSGRTKWTHLIAEDTTLVEADLETQELLKAVAKRPGTGSAGMNAATPVDEFSKPKKFKR